VLLLEVLFHSESLLELLCKVNLAQARFNLLLVGEKDSFGVARVVFSVCTFVLLHIFFMLRYNLFNASLP
jgi:hypothetical protein